MRTNAAKWNQLESQDDRKVAHIAALARIDTVFGGARALTIARHCSRWNAEEIVSDVYSRSTGKHSHDHEAWECPECGGVHLGFEAAADCCAFEAMEFACDDPEEMGISDDNWACGTLDVET